VAESTEPTLAGTAARLWAALIEGVQLRVELLALELAEERQRLVELVFSALATAVAVLLFAMSLNVLLLVVFWDTHRLAAVVGMCLFYAGAAAACVLLHRRRSRRLAPPFAASTAVLRQDQDTLREIL
jgi:uncharacterized membrane protein YqjE